MKTIFKQHHIYTDDEIKNLWENSLFVFDTNMLLNIYRYTENTSKDFIKIFTELKASGQLWIPHQVGYEFFERRLGVMSDIEEYYSLITKKLENILNDFKPKMKYHPSLDLKQIKENVNSSLKKALEEIKEKKKAHPNWMENDEILRQIEDIFDGCVGDAYNDEKLQEIYTEGAQRYENKIPPGFEDNDKHGNSKYGDLILWKQIIDKAEGSKRTIIFITGDRKKDWWKIHNDTILYPLPQLKKEMWDCGKVDFHMYEPEDFLAKYGILKRKADDDKISDETKDEVKALSNEHKAFVDDLLYKKSALADLYMQSAHHDIERAREAALGITQPYLYEEHERAREAALNYSKLFANQEYDRARNAALALTKSYPNKELERIQKATMELGSSSFLDTLEKLKGTTNQHLKKEYQDALISQIPTIEAFISNRFNLNDEISNYSTIKDKNKDNKNK